MIHVLETWNISSLKLLWGKREECRKREWLVYIFLVLRYYALFAGRCLIGRWESGSLGAPDLAILCHDLHADRTFSFGTMVARRLHTNRSKGVIYAGIYASRLTKHFELPFRHEEAEEMLLPTKYLDCASMILHNFIDNDKHKRLLYKLVFSQGTREIIPLPAPSLFNIYPGRYIIMTGNIYEYWSLNNPQHLS